MIKIFASIFLTGLSGLNANAQIRRATDSTQNVVSNPGKKTGRLETMSSLNLTKEQMSQVKEIRQNMKQQKEAINNDQSLNNEQKQSKLKDLRKEQQEKLNRILTSEQMEKLKEERIKTRVRQSTFNQSDSSKPN